MKVIWTQEALDRLSDIEDFISQGSPENAIRFLNYLIQRGEGLAEFPRLGRVVPEISNPDIREILAKEYRIVYKLQEKTIEILTVFKGRKTLDLTKLDME